MTLTLLVMLQEEFQPSIYPLPLSHPLLFCVIMHHYRVMFASVQVSKKEIAYPTLASFLCINYVSFDLLFFRMFQALPT